VIFSFFIQAQIIIQSLSQILNSGPLISFFVKIAQVVDNNINQLQLNCQEIIFSSSPLLRVSEFQSQSKSGTLK
jgi:hypothetical protein